MYLTALVILLLYIQHICTFSCEQSLKEFSGFSGVRSVECIQDNVHCFVNTALREWRGRFVKRERLEDLWNGIIPKNYMFHDLHAMVQIIGNKVYYRGSLNPRANEGWRQDLYRARIRSFFTILFAVLSSAPLPDT